MHLRPTSLRTLFLLWLVILPGIRAQVMTSRSGHFGGWVVLFAGQAVGVSWTQSATYTDVSISAELTGFGRTTETGRAFLTNSIGPSTTPANELAFSNFLFPASESYVTLFNNLTLSPGSYYLSLVGDSPSWGSGWIVSNSDTIYDAPGISSLSNLIGYTSPRLTFVPASDFYLSGVAAHFQVEGVLQTPEPSTAALGFSLALVTGLFLCNRQRLKRSDAETADDSDDK